MRRQLVFCNNALPSSTIGMHVMRPVRGQMVIALNNVGWLSYFWLGQACSGQICDKNGFPHSFSLWPEVSLATDSCVFPFICFHLALPLLHIFIHVTYTQDGGEYHANQKHAQFQSDERRWQPYVPAPSTVASQEENSGGAVPF